MLLDAGEPYVRGSAAFFVPGTVVHASSGNVGSLRRLEYTVHGDTVNTASRIEGPTKTLGGPILLSESTREALLRPPADLRPIGEVEVRGRQSGVVLWTVDGAGTPAGSERRQALA